jgi:hypothetical protein
MGAWHAWRRRFTGKGPRLAARLRRSAFFDAAWYLAQYPDVAAAGVDPAEHYLQSGASEGRDPGPRFSTRGYLAAYPEAARSGQNPLLYRDAMGHAWPPVVRLRPEDGVRVLVLDDEVPYADLGSGMPRALVLLRTLRSLGYQVVLYPLIIVPADAAGARAALPGIRLAAEGPAGLAAFLSRHAGAFDVALACRPHNLRTFLDACRASPAFLERTPLVYDAEAVVALREAIRARLEAGAAHASGDAARDAQSPALLRELQLPLRAAVTLAVNPAEADLFRNAGCKDVRVLGHGLAPAPETAAFEARAGLLFVGRLMDPQSPNGDSLRWFVREVLPRLRPLLGAACQADFVGECHPDLARELAGPGLRFHGRVSDIAHFYASARVFIAPTRFAAGIAHKVHEAAARGVPVVASALIAGQLGWRDGMELLVADDPEAYAQAVARLHGDGALWEHLRANALRAVARDCDPRVFANALDGALRDAVRAARPAPPEATG